MWSKRMQDIAKILLDIRSARYAVVHKWSSASSKYNCSGRTSAAWPGAGSKRHCFIWVRFLSICCYLLIKSHAFEISIIYLVRYISSTESDVNLRISKALTSIDKLSIIGKSDLSNKMEIFPNCGRVIIAVWLHQVKSKKILGLKSRWELLKDAAYCFE